MRQSAKSLEGVERIEWDKQILGREKKCFFKNINDLNERDREKEVKILQNTYTLSLNPCENCGVNVW